MTKVLITGANGFIGSNLTRDMYRLGYEVKIMVRPTADLKAIADIPCEIFTGRLDDAEQVMRAVEGCKVVVHAGCITDQWGVSFDEYEKVNFTGTQHIVRACLHHKAEKLIYVSTANTIGPGTRRQPGTELNGFSLFNAGSGYINSKYLAQQYVLEQVERAALPAVVVNPTFMIGPNDVKPSSGKLLLYGVGKRILFYPPGGKNFVHIQDVCRGIISAIGKGKTGDCYLLAGQNLSYRQFFRMVDDAQRRRTLLIRIPPLALKIAGMAGSALAKLTGRSPRLNYTSAYLLCLQNYYTGRKSERELQLRYIPVETAVREAFSWFRENAYF